MGWELTFQIGNPFSKHLPKEGSVNRCTNFPGRRRLFFDSLFWRTKHQQGDQLVVCEHWLNECDFVLISFGKS